MTAGTQLSPSPDTAEIPPPKRGPGRPSEIKLIIGAMLLDSVVLFVAFLGGYWTRFSTGWFQGMPEPLTSEHVSTLFVLLPVWILIHGMSGLYRPRVIGTFLDPAVGVLKTVTLGYFE